MISAQLNEIVQKALQYAKEQRHEYLTIEHIFYQILLSDEGASIIQLCGGDPDKMQEQTQIYIQKMIEPLPEGIQSDPYETQALSRVIDNMIRHIQSASKQNAEVGDLLAALYEEEQSFATMLLHHYNISRLDILEVISHNTQEIQHNNTQDSSYLARYTIDLLQKVRDGKIDPVIGRKKEIQRVIQILCRRKKNNPILVGESGVGKTAIAEGLAHKIVEQKVPALLQNTQLFALDLGALLAGTKYRGEFEKRLKGVMDELLQIPNAILFIDEIHTLIGAGSTSGSMDAANQLKPALASGALTCMGATTYAEYRNGFEKDKALARRFSKVEIKEPDYQTTYKILKGLQHKYESHHDVHYTNKALHSAIELSMRYINERFLPDKAIDLIDETAAALHLKKKKKNKITASDIQNTIASMLQIPAHTLKKDDTQRLQELESKLQLRVIGQDHAIKTVVQSIKRAKAGLHPSNKPIASFLFSGPTGVGKTELAQSLSDILGINFEKFDMSEYMEKHALSRLVGAPPGYVGYEQGGLLTEAIKKNPYTVLLLDEIEKAHPDLVNILLQIMDSASLTDNNGYTADFQNVILIMTSNLGANARSVMGFAKDETLALNEELNDFFTPEFRNRLDAIIPFNALSIEIVEKIVHKLLQELNQDLKKKGITLEYSTQILHFIAQNGYDKQMGARPLKRYIQEHITNQLTDAILFTPLQNGGTVTIDIVDNEITLSIQTEQTCISKNSTSTH